MSFSVVMIGAGNLATHLAMALTAAGNQVVQVYSQTAASASALAEKTGAGWTTSPAAIVRDAQIYFLAVKDSAMLPVLRESGLSGQLLVHCAGSVPMTVLHGFSDQVGVLYPLQTFSKNREVNFRTIPVFIEAATPDVETILRGVASQLSETVVNASSEQRQALHLAAVFACNFVNHFYAVAEELCAANHLSFDYLKPLIRETARKIETISPFEAQTGPAVRFDRNVMDTHLAALGKFPGFQNLYETVSQSIFDLHQKK
ncbi:MAG TPA: F420-dependent NADP oxidoreductase [Prolixibacteraceae bacterium]|nr:F420-dependent NADP oxidoreductase [Prolixibacteraceae bacterium]